MEIILAIVVASAVIFFGALISMGNERQRRAIDDLREQVVLWAVQDLRLKRKQIAHVIHVDNPSNWFSQIASKALGYNLKLQFEEAFSNPDIIVFTVEGEMTKVIFSLLAPGKIKKAMPVKKNRLLFLEKDNPLSFLSRISGAYEINILTNGSLFDLELLAAWRNISPLSSEVIDRVWMYTT